MTVQDIADGFVKYRKKIGKWYEDGRNLRVEGLVSPPNYGVTWEHYQEGFKDGYEKRRQDEVDELCESL